jgi:hypothetical protein
MPLGLPTGGDGNFVPWVKYNAKAGRWYTKTDDGTEFEVGNFVAVFDIGNLKTGYLFFDPGQAPMFEFDSRAGANDAARPNDQYRRGFMVHVFSGKNLLGVRELASTSGVMNKALNAVYDAYEIAPERAQGLVPVIKCTKIEAVTTKHGTNYAPELSIIQWVARPPDFDLAIAAAAAAAGTPAAGTVPPPVAAPGAPVAAGVPAPAAAPAAAVPAPVAAPAPAADDGALALPGTPAQPAGAPVAGGGDEF